MAKNKKTTTPGKSGKSAQGKELTEEQASQVRGGTYQTITWTKTPAPGKIAGKKP